MASINKEVFVAKGREERVHYSKSYVIKKKHLRTASLIGKIVMKTSNIADPVIKELGVADAVEHTADRKKFSKEKLICPFIHLGFTGYNGDHREEGRRIGSDDEENTYYMNEIVFTKQEVVSRSLISNKLVAVQYHKSPETTYPDPVPLSSSMASFEDGKWDKFSIQKQVLPSNLIRDCLQSVIRTDQWDKMFGQEESGLIDLSSVETIGIICGERFGTGADLNKHVHKCHGGIGLPDLPLAVSTDIVEEDRRDYEIDNDIIRRCQWAEVHEFDSTKEVINKLTTAIRIQLSHKVTGDVNDKTEFSGKDMIGILKQIFIEDKLWVQLTLTTAAARSGNLKKLLKWSDFENLEKVRFSDIREWITTMWENRAREPITKRISKLSRKVLTDCNQIIPQFAAALDEVKAALGPRNEILLPVRLQDTESTTPAMVDIRLLFATFKMTETWSTRNREFWDILRAENVDSILFPTTFRDKPLRASSLIEGLQAFENCRLILLLATAQTAGYNYPLL